MRVTEIPAAVAVELAGLRAENARLLRMLELSPRQAEPPSPAQAGFFDAPPGPVHKDSPNDAKVAFFRVLFTARTDIYATRIENSRTGWKGWLPAADRGCTGCSSQGRCARRRLPAAGRRQVLVDGR